MKELVRMQKLLTIILLSLVTLHTFPVRSGQAANPAILLRAEHLLDPTGNVLSPAAVLIENGKIKAVGSPSQLQRYAGDDTKMIDLGNASLLPGLIDGHTHLFLDIIVPPEAEQARHANGLFAPGQLPAAPTVTDWIIVFPSADENFNVREL